MASVFMCGVEDMLCNGSRFVWNLTVSTLRRWYTHRARTCQVMLRTWCGLREVYQMAEGRHCKVHLLDDRKLELLVQPKLLSRELLDLVGSHFNLKEKEYFGISFMDDTGQYAWLQLDQRVLDHDLPKKSGPVTLYFIVRFYIESITFLKEITTVELFFLNAKACVFKGQIEVDSETVFKLAALILQEARGDYSSDENARKDLKILPALPTRTLQEHPSLTYCEDRVIEHCKKLKGVTRGQAIVRYMKIVEALPTYGVHYYKVKDKQGIPWWLGISYKGIGQYDIQDKIKPRKLFQWKQLENLYFREKKFAVEVHDPRRISASKRTFGQSGFVVQTWYANNFLIKSIWVMAISQHQFYLDRKQSKAKIATARSLDEIAMDLTDSSTSRISKMIDGKNPVIMASSGSLISSGSIDSEVSEEQKTEKIQELKKKEKDLQDVLLKKIEELKKICMREAELTGKLPTEYPLNPGEKPPNVRRRMGTTFKLDNNILHCEEESDLQNLEHKFLIQQQMVEATKKLLLEPDLAKNVKRKRKQDYSDAIKRLQDIESAINEYRIKRGKDPTKRASLLLQDDIIPSESSSLSDTTTFDDDDSLYLQGQRPSSLQNSPKTRLPKDRSLNRKSSLNEQFSDMRLSGHREPTSTHSSPYKTAERKPHGGRSMPSTPVLTRNAYSSSHLQNEGVSHNGRQRRGSLESHTPLIVDSVDGSTTFSISKSQRSNSTEVLDDGSSYTSQSSSEYHSTPPKQNYSYTTQTLDNRPRDRRRHKKQNFSAANSGSMPNLAHKDARNGVYQTPQNQPSSSYYITGYSAYHDSDPYYNGGYIYENDTEGQYSVNPSYRSSMHYGYDQYMRYDADQYVPLSAYATLRLPKKKPVKTTQQITKNINKAIVAEHLRGWYQRAAFNKDGTHGMVESERGSQRSLCYASMQVPSSPSIRPPSCSSVSSTSTAGSRWAHSSTLVYPNTVPHASYAGYSTAYSSTPLPSRTFHTYTPQMDNPDVVPLSDGPLPDTEDILWHEDSKPGTLV
ncbi:FERM domain-containing protein 4B isoform X1 [Bufo gargarizans]|uniref:FERM domain-containing protein 4B isoform X1 n=2 Tax=Bufo gargarizans TaxID=30331 RepID=UPI001CF49D47|nr:FERM domain-containing protein 4B isoform X1 [Bufo gargarizans]